MPVSIVVVLARQSHLLEMVGALNAAGRFPRRLHGREQQRHQNADDGNDNQQFHERETATTG
jgi:hypothetical protein